MYNITLLSSFHLIHGKCNPAELYKIIEEIRPEVIFEELCFETFSFVYSESYIPETLEPIAIKNYLRNYSIKHFPVATYPINESDLFNGANEIAIINSDYSKLWNEQLSNIAQDGYNFLNSNACSKLLDKMRIVEESALSVINDDKLIHDYKSENELHNKREYEMLQNIYNLSTQYPYNKALFICGAQHRKPFINKILEFDSKEKLKMNWTFYGDL